MSSKKFIRARLWRRTCAHLFTFVDLGLFIWSDLLANGLIYSLYILSDHFTFGQIMLVTKLINCIWLLHVLTWFVHLWHQSTHILLLWLHVFLPDSFAALFRNKFCLLLRILWVFELLAFPLSFSKKHFNKINAIQSTQYQKISRAHQKKF